jgi:hypothetical protein
MKIKAFATMMVVVAGLTIVTAVKAGDWDKQTNVTLNAAVAVPGRVLAPGRYIFKLADNNSDRNIVQIFNEDQSHIIATLLAAPAQRNEVTAETVITLKELTNGGPEALAKWFYPGELDGVEFLYRGSQE